MARYPAIEVTPEARRIASDSVQLSGLSGDYQALSSLDPRFAEVAGRLAMYLGRKVRHPHTNKPLLHQCLAEAICTAVAGHPGTTVQQRLDAFVEAIVTRLPLVLRYRISRDGVDWDPLFGEPLLTWLRAGDFVVEAATEIADMVPVTRYRSVLAGRLRGEASVVLLEEQGAAP